MKRYWATMAVATVFGLSACDSATTADDRTDAAATAATVEEAPAVAVEPATTVEAPTPPAAGSATPLFAIVYPGAAVEAPPLMADGPAGPGGMVSFQTEATPEEVIAFYRTRADEAGLKTIMSMSQGDARAYGAAGDGPHGASVRVVASPGEGGRTSVQLAWSAGG